MQNIVNYDYFALFQEMYNNKVWFMDDRHLESFWNYHQAALRWFKTHRAAREYAISGSYDTISSSIDTNSNTNKGHFIKSTVKSSYIILIIYRCCTLLFQFYQKCTVTANLYVLCLICRSSFKFLF